MKWLADTHALFWAVVDSRRLGFEARHIMLTAKSAEIGIPSAAIMELGRLIDAGTTDFAMRPSDAFASFLSRHPVLPVSLDAAVKAPRLNLPHGDPFDRLIVAEAMVRGVPLITKDANIADSGLVPVIW
jgi:PIN domain nuclease of toxin-antitoxin system